MQKPTQGSKPQVNKNKNPLENLSDLGSGMLDQFFGNYDSDDLGETKKYTPKEAAKAASGNKEFKIFNYNEYSETTLIKRKIAELTDLIKREIDILKKENSGLLNQVKDVEKLTINDIPEKPGVYHIRFLEIVLDIVRHLRAKVSESKTWLEAMVSKKKKRGSLFAARSKKSGTQYSQSQELQTARSVQ